jgi:hypothetical protein
MSDLPTLYRVAKDHETPTLIARPIGGRFPELRLVQVEPDYEAMAKQIVPVYSFDLNRDERWERCDQAWYLDEAKRRFDVGLGLEDDDE